MYFVSIFDERGENVAVKAVEAGLMNVARAIGTEDRSVAWQQLVDAEAAAKENAIGLHGTDRLRLPRYQELLLQPPSAAGAKKGPARGPTTRKEPVERTKGFEQNLKGKDLEAVVEYLMNGIAIPQSSERSRGQSVVRIKNAKL